MKVRERVLKVEEHYSERERYTIITSRIRLKGMWLECAGFKPGDKAKVIELEPGKLLVERE